MKAIKNIIELKEILENENPRWQEVLYHMTGVIALIDGRDGFLVSNCGYIDLDNDVEYCSVSGVDKTEYCEIKSIDELAKYILSMESYNQILKDVPIGSFSKSELFWAIKKKVVHAEENQMRSDGSLHEDWDLFGISEYQNHTELRMALVDYDYTEIWLDLSENTSLNQALEMLVSELNEIIVSSELSTIPMYRVIEKTFEVPKTFNELISQIVDGEFSWLKEML